MRDRAPRRRRRSPEIFRDIPWSSGRVLRQTVGRLSAAGLEPVLLEPSYDVDRPEDLERLAVELGEPRSGRRRLTRVPLREVLAALLREVAVIPILDARRMRAADAAAIRRGVPSLELMESAARRRSSSDAPRRSPTGRIVVVVCGPGNNGGDGLAAARLLARRGLSPSRLHARRPDGYRGDAAVNARRARAAGLTLDGARFAPPAARR